MNMVFVKIIKFIIYEDSGWLCAVGEHDTIFTQAKNQKKLIKNINEAVRCHFDIKEGEFEISLKKK